MKFNSGDILYYICPFIFTIEKVKIDMVVKEADGTFYYIDQTGAYLHEGDLFVKLKEAQMDANNKLNKFCHEKRYEILNKIPTFEEDY